MDNKQRAFIYAFMSTVFSDKLSKKGIEDLKNNPDLLDLIGENAKRYFEQNDIDTLDEELNIDFTSAFLANSHPVESSITDAKHQISTGLENPVMSFYIESGFDVNLNNTNLLTPDHIAIELGFMQNLALSEDVKTQKEFMRKHVLKWMIPYFIGAKYLVETPFYLDFLDFATDFLLSDYEALNV
ncbi:MAG TPA: molecular chaperone TorD family protein [Campylobacterales bacterium]|nr:molecular chaperone TorD family protein [Campylobacterales bacterium]